MPSTPTSRTGERGLTLIEVLVIAPLIILLIAVLVGYVTALTGESLRANAKNALAYDTQAALDNIETTAATAIHFCGTYTFSPSSTDTCNTPTDTNQGSDNDTASFAYTTGGRKDLIVLEYATTASPTDPSRTVIHQDAPHACGSGDETLNQPLLVPVVYFVESGTLYKRTLTPGATGCSAPFQRTSCAAGVVGSACTRQDEKLLTDVSEFTVAYYTTASASGLEVEPEADVVTAGMAVVTVGTTRQVGGEPLTHNGTLRVSSINIGNLYRELE